ncbi:MAG: type II secretion system protein GspD [Pseudohongiellaceae bacterium]
MSIHKFLCPCLALVLSLTGCVNTGESEKSVTSHKPKAELWQEMPDPITQRYPILDQSQASDELPVADVKKDIEEYYNCTNIDESSLIAELPLIDVSFIEADILDALLELSLLTGVSIITDDSIEGMVSINFSGQSLENVIAAIIAPGNFGYKVYDTFIYVGSQSPVSPSFHLLSSTCLYKPVFLHPKQIVELLTPFYQQYVNYFEGHDHISIVAPDSIQSRIQEDILIFDQSPEQILLEMSIVEVSSEALDLLGFKWNQYADARELLMREGRGGGSVFSYYDPTTTASPIAQAFIDSVSALGTGEEAQIRATPSMVTLNGREANFSSNQTAWLPVLSAGANNQVNAVNFGVDLRIVPYISQDEQIRLEIIQASVSDLTETLQDQPRLISHAISTSVLMKNGETLVLGGLLQKKTANRKSQVPGASKTPLLGNLFRHKEEESITTEVLIVIRPKIMGT